MSSSASAAPAPSFSARARKTFQDHPFTSIGGVWGSVLGATVLYLAPRKIPTQLKIIQARIVAQATLLAIASAAAILHFSSGEDDSHGGGPAEVVDLARIGGAYKRFDLAPPVAATVAAVAATDAAAPPLR